MLPRDWGDYGAPKVDALPVETPTAELPASQYNRMAEDVAQCTRTVPRAIVVFGLRTEAPPFVVPPAAISIRTVWGSGSGQKPTVTKSAQGRYSVVFATSFLDALGVTETVNFFGGTCILRADDPTDFPFSHFITLANNGMTFVAMSAWVDADKGVVSGTPMTVTLVLY